MGLFLGWWMDLRWEDDGLADHLAAGVLGNIYSISSGARSSTDKGAFTRCCPTSMADVSLGDAASIGICGSSSKHTETLQYIRTISKITVIDLPSWMPWSFRWGCSKHQDHHCWPIFLEVHHFQLVEHACKSRSLLWKTLLPSNSSRNLV